MLSLDWWLRKRTARVKTGILTFLCLSGLLVLLEAWRQDAWSTFDNVPLGSSVITNNSTSINPTPALYQTASVEHASEAEVVAAPQDVIEGNATTTSSFSTPTPPPVKLPALVAASVLESTVEWMNDMTNEYEIFPYIVSKWVPGGRLETPANKGREAMVYLSYLVNNYDDLPPYAIFTHGHRTAWHQEIDIVRMIGNLRIDALEEAGYVSFRCNWMPSCPAELRPVDHDAVVWGQGTNLKQTEDAIAEAWPSMFPGVEIPRTIASPCCAQFAVTKTAMMRRTKEDYARLRDWLLHTKLNDAVSGRVMEKLWAYMMTGESVHCPSPDVCACKYFGSCGRHVWPTMPPGVEPLPTGT